jgi:hypothetical protein
VGGDVARAMKETTTGWMTTEVATTTTKTPQGRLADCPQSIPRLDSAPPQGGRAEVLRAKGFLRDVDGRRFSVRRHPRPRLRLVLRRAGEAAAWEERSPLRHRRRSTAGAVEGDQQTD